jgi:putative FmdB family regulatory protein
VSASQTGSEKGGAGVPTYQYTCTDCGEPLEVVQKFTDDALIECPQCGGKLRKVYSGVGIVFKGSGFYRTDSRSSDSAVTPPAETAKTDKSEKAAASTSSSDSGSSSTPAAPASPPSTPKSTPAPSSTPASGGSGGKAASS